MDKELVTYQPESSSVVVYHSDDDAVQLEVQLSEETVWLTQKQMSWLFDTTSQNITIHINNVYKEHELEKGATCKDFLQVQNAHDRILCIDNTVYHIGASLKDLGKKWFAFGRMEKGADALLQKMRVGLANN